MKVSSSNNILNIYREQLKKVGGDSGDAFKKVLETSTPTSTPAAKVTLTTPSGVNLANPVFSGKPAPVADPVVTLKFAAEVVANQPEVRSEKVSRLKELIDRGQYNIPSEKVAEKLFASGVMTKSWDEEA